MKQELIKAYAEYNTALLQEQHADPDFTDVAIARTNYCKNKIDAILRRLKHE